MATPNNRRRRAKTAVGAALAVGMSAGCGTAEPPAPPASPEPEVTPAPAMEPIAPVEAPSPETMARVEGLSRWLDGCVVGAADPSRGKLYTWTTDAQIEELRRDRRFLSREQTRDGELSGFDARLAQDEHPIARFLRAPGRRARRFAWSNPWATRMGWEHGAYGEQLIEITMREDAWTAIYTPDQEPSWRVIDADGLDVEPARAASQAHRIAVVIHHGRGLDPNGVERAYREAVLVNERHIARWAVGTESITLRIARDVDGLRRLAEHWRLAPSGAPVDASAMTEWLTDAWSGRASDDPVTDRYRRCLAIGSTAYRASPEAIVRVAESLEQTPMPAPLTRNIPRPRPAAYGRARPAVNPNWII